MLMAGLAHAGELVTLGIHSASQQECQESRMQCPRVKEMLRDMSAFGGRRAFSF